MYITEPWGVDTSSCYGRPVILKNCRFALPLIFSLTFACGGKRNSAAPPAEACLAEGSALEGGGSVLRPASCMSACNQDSDCEAVNVSCPGCCDWEMLSVSYRESYSQSKTNECRAYSGLVCSCDEPPPQAVCRDHMCQTSEQVK